MRANDFLPEAGLSRLGLRPSYVDNLITMIDNQQPVPLTPAGQKIFDAKTVLLDPTAAKILKQALLKSGGKLNSAGYLDIDKSISILPTQHPKIKTVSLGNIEKSKEIKGKTADFNIGDIGEISLGVAAYVYFAKQGQPINFEDFVNFAGKLDLGTTLSDKGKVLSSMKFTASTIVQHESGKSDNLTMLIMTPGRSAKFFHDIIKNPETIRAEVKGAILSAIQYVNANEKLKFGIDKTTNDPNTNLIEIVSDGVSDQKATKADLTMSLDNEKFNLLSAKAGVSQLGQASGHDWNKQKEFFQTVFGVNVSEAKNLWGETNEQHISALESIWQKQVIPKIINLTGGDSTKKEIKLVRSMANGLIRYSNNISKTGEVETIDIVKLIANPNSPGYKLMRIDKNLISALEKTDLVGKATANRLGVSVSGLVNGKPVLLFKARSYYSPAGKTVRTIIEGGDLLDDLAAVIEKTEKTPNAKSTTALPNKKSDQIGDNPDDTEDQISRVSKLAGIPQRPNISTLRGTKLTSPGVKNMIEPQTESHNKN